MEVIELGHIDYDGSQLHHAFAYKNTGTQNALGPTISYFVGKANVKEHLVDLEDSIANDFISSKEMVHFIIEIPNASIQETVLWQRLFMYQITSTLKEDLQELGDTSNIIYLDGDDIMIDNNDEADSQKLSVSIATLSLFSGLIHAGINVNVGNNCPVSAIGLNTLNIMPSLYSIPLDWGSTMADNFAEEYNNILNATYKVVGVN